MTIKELLAKVTKLQEHSDALRGAVRSLQAIDADTNTEFARLMKGDLRHFPTPHTTKVRDELRKELQAKRARHAALALFHVERALMELEPDVQTVRATSMRAPSLEDAFRRRSKTDSVSAEIYVGLATLRSSSARCGSRSRRPGRRDSGPIGIAQH